jgi:hypothetical protein
MLPLFFILLLYLAASPRDAAALTREDYPKGFTFGAGTSAYQVRMNYLARRLICCMLQQTSVQISVCCGNLIGSS